MPATSGNTGYWHYRRVDGRPVSGYLPSVTAGTPSGGLTHASRTSIVLVCRAVHCALRPAPIDFPGGI